jgi:hypothetical protein
MGPLCGNGGVFTIGATAFRRKKPIGMAAFGLAQNADDLLSVAQRSEVSK